MSDVFDYKKIKLTSIEQFNVPLFKKNIVIIKYDEKIFIFKINVILVFVRSLKNISGPNITHGTVSFVPIYLEI